MTSLVLRRSEGQAWRDAAIAQGEKYGMGLEVQTSFDIFKIDGASDEDAAMGACSEWDVLELGT